MDLLPVAGPPLPMSDSQRMSKIIEDATAQENRDYPSDPQLEGFGIKS